MVLLTVSISNVVTHGFVEPLEKSQIHVLAFQLMSRHSII